MKNKVIIGLKLQFLVPALVASILALLGVFLPYVSTSAENSSLLSVMGSSWIMVVAVFFAVTAAVLGIVSFVRPTIWGVRIWAIVDAVLAIALTVLLFASKSILDGSGVLSEPFLVKYFGIGYWLSLVTSFVALIFSMKTAKINTGYIVLTVLGVIWLFPILWMVLTSLRAESGYYVGYFIPKGLTFDNYVNLFTNPSVLPFGRWWVNTMIVAVCGCLINTTIVLATAFTLSRTRFAGRKTFMKILMIIGMFPGFMSMIAVYNILKGIGLNQSIVALIVVGAAAAAMGYHVCKGFFDTIPKALDEAAIVDGATRWQIFTRITIPLSKPIAIYTLLTNFLGAWSDYIFPSILFGDKQANYTVAVGLYWMTDFRRIDKYYTQFAAGAMVIAVPIVILFICLQKFYVEGLSGSVKG
ncbi:MAG: ABC transporter permease subunit [Lachnospiraceae bacterium]|nr:ABC transporter permease subunit [Lachnospiraceae bacterium]